MRKRYRVLLVLAVVAALAVPVGFALSLDSRVEGSGLHAGAVTLSSSPFSLPDAAKLLGIGTMLFGLAAAVRKAT